MHSGYDDSLICNFHRTDAFCYEDRLPYALTHLPTGIRNEKDVISPGESSDDTVRPFFNVVDSVFGLSDFDIPELRTTPGNRLSYRNFSSTVNSGTSFFT